MAETEIRISKKKAEEEAALAERRKRKNRLRWLQNLKSQMRPRSKRVNSLIKD